MKVPTREVVEVAGILSLVTAVFLATGLIWPGLVGLGVGLLYLAHFWEWDGVEIHWKAKKKDEKK